MTSILIADRDQNERVGIRWLISSNGLPITSIDLASSYDEVIQLIEAKTPDIACIEIDMIPKDKRVILKNSLGRYVHKVIFITAEATFEKAMQAIDVHAEDLWVKPMATNQMIKTLKKCLLENRNVMTNKNETRSNMLNDVSYLSLFSEQKPPNNNNSLFLIQSENRNKTLELHLFLQKLEYQLQTTIFPLSDSVICVMKETNPDLLKFEGNRILKAWEEFENEPLAIVVLANARKESLQQKYKQAKKVLELTFYKGYRQVLHVTSDFQWVQIDPFLSSSEQREWVDMLHADKRDELKSWMYAQFLMYTGPYPDPGLVRIRITSILAQIRRFMKTYELEKKRFESYYHQIFELILYNPVLYKIIQELLLFIYNLLDGAIEQKSKSRLNVIDKGILYIEEHFHESDITLEEVANVVDRSSAYFSHLLSTKKGLTFKQILTNTRIEEAKRLLLETKLTIKQITIQTGFTNANYFSRIFKETTNMTPTSFRSDNRLITGFPSKRT